MMMIVEAATVARSEVVRILAYGQARVAWLGVLLLLLLGLLLLGGAMVLTKTRGCRAQAGGAIVGCCGTGAVGGCCGTGAAGWLLQCSQL